MRKAPTLWVLLAGIALFAAAACGGGSDTDAHNKPVTIKGSDTMVILAQRWAETFMTENPGFTIQVTGGGSGTGIAALINGGTDICNASRPMKDSEKKLVKTRHGKDVQEIPVAMDGVAIYVHESSPVQSLTTAQLKGIYTGRITNWRDVGGKDGRIVPYSRENNSGTYVFFKEHVLANEDFAREIQTLPGTAAVVNAVSKDPASIGYGGAAYAQGIREVPIRRDDTREPVAPSLQSVQSGQYPLSRSLFFYTTGAPAGNVKVFIDWVLGPEGQKICEEVGYYPIIKK
jgi:phosphate transport system substrate-binding protein